MFGSFIKIFIFVYKNMFPNLLPPLSPPPLTCQTSVCGEEGWEDGKEATYGHSLSTYGGQHFQDKPVSNPGHIALSLTDQMTNVPLQDLISSGYVSYGSYGRDCPNTNTSFPTSDRCDRGSQ